MVGDHLGLADPLKRAVRHRSSIQKRRDACAMRLDALVELLGPGWLDLFGTVSYGKTAAAVLEHCAKPHAVHKLGQSSLAKLLIRVSRGNWRQDKADEILTAAAESLEPWVGGGLDFDELANDIAILRSTRTPPTSAGSSQVAARTEDSGRGTRSRSTVRTRRRA